MSTIEAAGAISALFVVTALILSLLLTFVNYLQAIDSAGAAARAAAIGVPYSPPRGEVRLSSDGVTATATATIPGGLLTIPAVAIFPVEGTGE